MKIGLGDRVRDRITGFEGVTVGRAEYLTGCTQFGVSPEAKDNKFANSEWFDETRLELLTKRAIAIPGAVVNEPVLTGGPATDEAPRR